MENILKGSHPKMTCQDDRQDESLTSQVHDEAGHCLLTGRYFEPWALQKLRISKNLEAKGSSVLPHEGLGVGGNIRDK